MAVSVVRAWARSLSVGVLAVVCALVGGCAGGAVKNASGETEISPQLKAAQGALPEGLDEVSAAQWVLDESARALNSAALLEKASRRTRSVTELAAQGMTLTSETYQWGPDKAYMRQELPGLGVSEAGYDGEVGWSRDPLTGLRVREGTELEEVRRLTLRCEADYSQVYQAWRLVEVAEEKGRAFYRLELTPEVGDVEIHDIDAVTLKPWRSEQVAEGVQGRMKIKTTIEAYEEVEGIGIPVRLRSRVGPLEMITTVEEVVYGDEIDPTLFSMPPREP